MVWFTDSQEQFNLKKTIILDIPNKLSPLQTRKSRFQESSKPRDILPQNDKAESHNATNKLNVIHKINQRQIRLAHRTTQLLVACCVGDFFYSNKQHNRVFFDGLFTELELTAINTNNYCLQIYLFKKIYLLLQCIVKLMTNYLKSLFNRKCFFCVYVFGYLSLSLSLNLLEITCTNGDHCPTLLTLSTSEFWIWMLIDLGISKMYLLNLK